MSEHQKTQIPKSRLSYARVLFTTWWTLVPLGLLAAYGIIASWVGKFISVQRKAQWENLLSRFGWHELLILALLSAVLVVFEHSYKLLQEQATEISDLKKDQNKEWVELFNKKHTLEAQIAAEEMLIPSVRVPQAAKIEKDTLDYAMEQITRKKGQLEQIENRMKNFK